MAYRCDYCRKGAVHGHAVSHAKNRTKRLFKPNLQKLKVLKDGISIRVKFCTRCIKRLKKDGRLGSFLPIFYAAKPATEKVLTSSIKLTAEKKPSKKDITDTSKVIAATLPAMKKKQAPTPEEIQAIEDIVGKKK